MSEHKYGKAQHRPDTADVAYECEDLGEFCVLHQGSISTPFGVLRPASRDGQTRWQLWCPGCGDLADLDEDQLHGRVSTWHETCGYHETHDFYAEIPF